MLEILTVCTGNVSRSPLAEQLLRLHLGTDEVVVSSAGTHALVDYGMDPGAAKLAIERGVPAEDSAAHRGRWVRESIVKTPDLILAMSREHRRYVVELDPSRNRSVFTVRELARLAAPLTDVELRVVADAAGSDPHVRLKALLLELTFQRGQVPAPVDLSEDDVADPYRRSWDAYVAAADALDPAIEQTLRVIRIAVNR
jgi:protein-tyrosine phosphatase